jgi:hypothetical protein
MLSLAGADGDGYGRSAAVEVFGTAPKKNLNNV